MTFINNSADASFYYHEDSAADLARMDSSAMYGNLADAMKNATILFPPPQIIQTTMISPPLSENKQVDFDPVDEQSKNDEGDTSGNRI